MATELANSAAAATAATTARQQEGGPPQSADVFMGCAASAASSGGAMGVQRPKAPDADSKRVSRAPASENTRQHEIARLVADGRARDAATLMQDMVGSDPANGRLHTQLGELMKQAGMNGYLSEFRLGATTVHDHPSTPAQREAERVSRAHSCVKLAIELSELHDDLTDAFELCHEAHRLDPTNAEAYVHRSWMLWELDGHSDADSTGEREVALRKAIKSIGDSAIIAAAHAQLANICLHKERRVRPLQSTICFILAVAVTLFPLCLANPVSDCVAERCHAPRAEGDRA